MIIERFIAKGTKRTKRCIYQKIIVENIYIIQYC